MNSEDSMNALGIKKDSKFETIQGVTCIYTRFASTKEGARAYAGFRVAALPVPNPKGSGTIVASGLLFRLRVYGGPMKGFESVQQYPGYLKAKLFFPVEIAECGAKAFVTRCNKEVTPAVIAALKQAVKASGGKMDLTDTQLREVIEYYVNQIPLVGGGQSGKPSVKVFKGVSFKKANLVGAANLNSMA